VFTGKNGSFLGENDMLSMRGKAWNKNMGKFSLSCMVRRTLFVRIALTGHPGEWNGDDGDPLGLCLLTGIAKRPADSGHHLRSRFVGGVIILVMGCGLLIKTLDLLLR
jgi:hypothetical protein